MMIKERLATIRTLVADDLKAVDGIIHQELQSQIPLIQDLTHHIIRSGGKRIRPLIVLLAAKAMGYQSGQEHRELAVIIEFVHTATLLHDDVVDHSALRRGQETANAIWGNAASVLVGDFLYSRAFQLLTRRGHVAIMQALAGTTNAIAEGEVLQLMNRQRIDLSEEEYFSVIDRKTARLFSSSAEIGAILNNASAAQQKALADYGLNLGLAFQIVDDVLDYSASAEQIGKNIGDDLAEGKMTLPMIYALQQSDAATVNRLKKIIETANLDELPFIIDVIRDKNIFAQCIQKAKNFALCAANVLNFIPDSDYRTGLEDLIEFVIERDY